jgi:GT2 family glycosyltransferase
VERRTSAGFTIVIPTHNRYEKLMNLIASISRIKLTNLDEVIVIDDSDVKRELPSKMGEIKIRTVTSDRRIYISEAKNIGIYEAKSEFIYFIDDDNEVDESTFAFAIRVLEHNEDVGAVLPSVLYKQNRDLVWVYATPFKKGRWEHELIGRNKPRDSSLENRVVDTDALPNAFLARKAALQEVGGFSKILPIYNSAYLAYSLKTKGWKVVAHTGSFIFHDVLLPSKFGYWAEHQIPDKTRVKMEVRDWYIFMKIIHKDERLFTLKALSRSARFLVPNSIVYLLNGGKLRFALIKSEMEGVVDGLKASLDKERLELDSQVTSFP